MTSHVEIVLRPLSDWMTPWQADTLFGHLAWSIRYEEGEQALVTWLQQFDGSEPPFVLSDGFIGKWLPRPILPIRRRYGSTQLTLSEAKEAKKRKSQRWIDREALLRGEYDLLEVLSKQGDSKIHTVYHNVINRGSQTSLEENGLYALEQYGLPEGEETISFYAAVRDDAEKERLLHHLQLVAVTGYGKRKTSGLGHFSIAGVIPRDDWFNNSHANAEMWLTHGVPARNDPTKGLYRLDTKYGKIGEGWAGNVLPFKRPLTRVVPGSVFVRKEGLWNWSGQMIHGISEAYPQVVQYALALTLPLQLEEDRFEALDADYTWRI